jgi:hypothetical protein
LLQPEGGPRSSDFYDGKRVARGAEAPDGLKPGLHRICARDYGNGVAHGARITGKYKTFRNLTF